jgi:hypothetical protein
MSRKYLYLILIITSLFMFNCSNMPKPRNEGDSLCILISENPDYKPTDEKWNNIVIFEGPAYFQVITDSGKWDIYFLRLKPGEYHISRRMITREYGDNFSVDVPLNNKFNISPNSVYLFPIKLINSITDKNSIITKYEPVTPEDQREVTEVISDYLNFTEWFGCEFVGFGPYKPSFSIAQDTYSYSISSNPGGAEVFIDDELWGTTPMVSALPPGKHMLQVKLENYLDYSTFVDVQSEGEINIELSEINANVEGVLEIDLDNINILVVPLQNIGNDNYDYLQPVFSDIIKSRLMQETNFVIFDYPSIIQTEKVEYNPDFTYAEENGIDLLLYGYFSAEERELLVHASVYDVRSEMVKASIMYTGESGFSMFDSIDLMTEEFLQNITKALPEIGQDVIFEGDAIKSEIVAFETKRTENEVIEKRLERKNSISFGTMMGKYFFNLNNPGFESQIPANGPGLGITFIYERSLSEHISLPIIFIPNVNFTGHDLGDEFFMDIPLYFGPRYNFLGYKTELYFSLLGSIRFITGFEADNGENSTDAGPWICPGFALDTGAKIYTYKRISKPPVFVNIGMIFGIIGGYYDFSSSEFYRSPLDLWLYLNVGSRL